MNPSELESISEHYDKTMLPATVGPPVVGTLFLSPSALKALGDEKKKIEDRHLRGLKDYEERRNKSLEQLKEYTEKVVLHRKNFKEYVLRVTGLEHHPKANELFEFAELYYVPAFSQFSGTDMKYNYHSGIFNFLRRLGMLIQ